MTDYSKWKTRDLTITHLYLDPLNPRLPEADEGLSQPRLLAELVEHEKIYELAKDIADKGYYPTESLIVVEEDGKKYVAEGNRRLAALKLLYNPDAAPSKYQKRFRILSARIETIKKVSVVIAPSRFSAAPVIMSKHTSTQVRGWSRVMQAKFYKQLLDSGMTVKQVSEQYAVSQSDIKKFLRSHTMYNIACSLELPEEVLNMVLDAREFPMTTLDRLYNDPKVQKMLGIEFDNKKGLVGKVKSSEFKKGYSKIVTDVAMGNIDSRSLNTSKHIEAYIKSFSLDEKPNLRKKGTFTSDALTGEEDAAASLPSKPSKPKLSRVQRKSSSVIPTSFKCHVNDKRINDVFLELKKLKLETHKNASSIMLRVLLELSVGYYLEKTKKIKTLLAKHRKKNKPKDWEPTLKQMLAHMVNDDNDVDLSPNTRKAINKLLSSNGMLSADTLDFFVHNRRYCPTEEQLRSFWAALEEIFELTLVEPEVN